MDSALVCWLCMLVYLYFRERERERESMLCKVAIYYFSWKSMDQMKIFQYSFDPHIFYLTPSSDTKGFFWPSVLHPWGIHWLKTIGFLTNSTLLAQNWMNQTQYYEIAKNLNKPLSGNSVRENETRAYFSSGTMHEH